MTAAQATHIRVEENALDGPVFNALEQTMPAFESAAPYGAPAFWRFLEVAAEAPVTVLTAWRGETLTGVLPFARREEAIGPLINSMPWFGSLGGCWLKRRADGEIRDALIAAFHQFLKRENVASATLHLPPEETRRAYCRPLSGYVVVPSDRLCQITPLPDPDPPETLDERLMATLRGRMRRPVRKALKTGLEATKITANEPDCEDHWRRFHTWHKANMDAVGGRHKSLEALTALRRTLPEHMAALRVAWREGTPVSYLLTLAYGDRVEYLMPGISAEGRPMQANPFLLWHAMRAAAADGYRFWNWGGTWPNQTALHHFKAGFGAEDHRYMTLALIRDDAVESLASQMPRLRAAHPDFFIAPDSAILRLNPADLPE
ncbi:GNAT family N-acetyltransferase [Yunchengibacter salinarum]|uniref:GNAT family N-acetyltransferase n=1 Tax=Yunchengibacter salinarum TaxID=3133399 RepID=UPI0035B688E4